MRASRIEFKGFRRLADTATNVDGSLTAFVGFNEAGKTSLLHALAWFTSGGAITPIDHNRSRPPVDDSASVVKVYFQLDDSDKAALAGIEMDNPPTTLILHRASDGNRIRSLHPRPGRPERPFQEASERLPKAIKALATQLAEAASNVFRLNQNIPPAP